MLCAKFGMAQKARGAVSSVELRHVRIVMSRELKKERMNYDVIGKGQMHDTHFAESEASSRP